MGASPPLSIQTNGYDLSQQDKAYPTKRGTSLKFRDDGFTSEFPRPLLTTKIVQDGVIFQSIVNSLDVFARPLNVTQSSAPSP